MTAAMPRQPTSAASSLDANPGLPMLPYMLACCELKAGRTDEAIEALRSALVTTRMRVIAAKDANLDPVRDIPAFRELLNPSQAPVGGEA